MKLRELLREAWDVFSGNERDRRIQELQAVAYDDGYSDGLRDVLAEVRFAVSELRNHPKQNPYWPQQPRPGERVVGVMMQGAHKGDLVKIAVNGGFEVASGPLFGAAGGGGGIPVQAAPIAFDEPVHAPPPTPPHPSHDPSVRP